MVLEKEEKHVLPKEEIERIGKVLSDKAAPLKARFRALFALRNVGTEECVEWIGKSFSDDSALLKHELAYCLGQMQNPTAIPILTRVLEDTTQEPMVRHEAGEALGAIGNESSVQVLKKYSSDALPEVAETCQLALQRIEYVHSSGDPTQSPYDSIDPTPSYEGADVVKLGRILTNVEESLWNRYRAMFTLRNLATAESIAALAQGLYCEDSALFRHEVAYVLGQLQSPVAIQELTDRLVLESENGMVRHECAEALGAIGTPQCTEILEKYRLDKERVVRESCEVALDMAEYEQSGSFQYAGVL